MKTRLSLFLGFLLSLAGSSNAVSWDQVTFTVKLTYLKPVAHVPCHFYFHPSYLPENMKNNPDWNKWAYSDTNGYAAITFPAGEIPGPAPIVFFIAKGTGHFCEEKPAGWNGWNSAPDGVPDTICFNDNADEFFFGNPNNAKPDSLIALYTVLDGENDNPVMGATVTLNFKHRASESGAVRTVTATTNDDGEARVVMYNDILCRAVSVTVSADGFNISQEYVDSLEDATPPRAKRGLIIWDGENDELPKRTIRLTKGQQVPKDSFFVLGKILSAEGAPISRATVQVKLGTDGSAFPQSLDAVKSGDDGSYRVPWKNSPVWTRVCARITVSGAAGHLDTTFDREVTVTPSDEKPDTLSADITLVKAPQRDTLVIGGTLKDTSGAAVSGASVKVSLGSSEGSFTVTLPDAVISDASGIYVARYWNKDGIEHVFAKIDVNGNAAGYSNTSATGDKQIQPTDAVNDTLIIDAVVVKLPPVDTLVISGKVADTSGAAVSGATVTVSLDSVAGSYQVPAGTATSGTDGAFTVRWKNDRQWTNVFVKVTAKAAAYADTSALASKSGIVPNDGAADLISDVNVRMLKMPAADTLLIGGLVTDESGTTPIGNAAVEIGYSVNGTNFIKAASVMTGTSGIFYTKLCNTQKVSQFSASAGVTAAGYAGTVEYKTASIIPDDGKTDTVAFYVKLKKTVILPTDSVSFLGKVTAAPSGAPVSGAVVKLSVGTDTLFHLLQLGTTTGGAGNFEFRFANSVNATQAYTTLEVTAKGYRPYTMKMRITLSPGDGKRDTISISDCSMTKVAPDMLVVGGVVSNIATKGAVAGAKVTVTVASDKQLLENKCALESAPTGADGVFLVSTPNPNRIKRIYFKIDAVIKLPFLGSGSGSTSGFVDINPEDEINDTICFNVQMSIVSTVGGPFAVFAPKPVTLKIYNLNGRLIKTIHTNTARLAGESARQVRALGAQKLIVETKIDKDGIPQRKSKIAAR